MDSNTIALLCAGLFMAWAFGAWCGRYLNDAAWRANAELPMRVLSNGRFYKVRDVTDVPHSEWEWRPGESSVGGGPP